MGGNFLLRAFDYLLSKKSPASGKGDAPEGPHLWDGFSGHLRCAHYCFIIHHHAVAAYDGYDEKGNPYNAEDVFIRGRQSMQGTLTLHHFAIT